MKACSTTEGLRPRGWVFPRSPATASRSHRQCFPEYPPARLSKPVQESSPPGFLGTGKTRKVRPTRLSVVSQNVHKGLRKVWSRQTFAPTAAAEALLSLIMLSRHLRPIYVHLHPDPIRQSPRSSRVLGNAVRKNVAAVKPSLFAVSLASTSS